MLPDTGSLQAHARPSPASAIFSEQDWHARASDKLIPDSGNVIAMVEQLKLS